MHPEDDVIQAYAEGAATARDALHFQSCDECREKAEAYSRLFVELDAGAPAPAGLLANVMSAVRIEAARPAPLRWSAVARIAAAAAAAVLLFIAMAALDAPELLDREAPAIFARAADAIPAGVRAPAVVDQTFATAAAGISSSFGKARDAGSGALEPLRSSSAAPVVALSVFLAANAAAIWSLRRKSRPTV